ncbi:MULTISPECIES: glycosyltransferase family 4 protein [unclassified Synechococcus]|uniref:glycosyltransferase family 4 protein n=1 Tax=unclassified Synechococcus TaxID=2626047 RepID=UPI001409C935|nr:MULTISPECIES: glycosyltransferase family 4 protein [unclassified Synechococcus]
MYPPQELGGYGRCISDFVWGLLCQGHHVTVLTSNSSYLSPATDSIRNNESVFRSLLLKGSFENGISLETNLSEISRIDTHNIDFISNICKFGWDGCLLGNLDMIGLGIVDILSAHRIPSLHHIGFVDPPFPLRELPSSPFYSIASASYCVKDSLVRHGFPVNQSLVIYPGVRDDLFVYSRSGLSPSIRHCYSLHSSGSPVGSPANPLKMGFAGLIMASKGLHTLVQAAINLRLLGIYLNVSIAGTIFQSDYKTYLDSLISSHSLQDNFITYGQLTRDQLIRFWSLQHVGVFPSIHPEAFGISAAEIMCSGLLLCSTGVGGSSEIFSHGKTGLSFQPDNSQSLVDLIIGIINDKYSLFKLPITAYSHISSDFSVLSSSSLIEKHFLATMN